MDNMVQILLVEDNKMDIALTLDAFRQCNLGNKIEVAKNGEEALKYLLGEGKYKDREQFPLPHIILLDLKMPVMDGHEFLKIFKTKTKLKRIPVIILTSSKEEGDRASSYENGANSYLVKPVSFEGFLSVVTKITDYWISLNIEPPLD